MERIIVIRYKKNIDIQGLHNDSAMHHFTVPITPPTPVGGVLLDNHYSFKSDPFPLLIERQNVYAVR